MNNIIVTGGLGILGREIVNQLLKDKNNFIIIIDKEKSKKKIKTFKQDLKKVKFLNIDFTNKKKIFSVLKRYKISTVFHLGAVTQVLEAYNNPYKTFNSNIMGTINILEAIKDLNKNINFIYSSSDKAYGELKKKEYYENFPLKGDFPYDVSKSASDLIAQTYSKTYQINIGIVRSGNIYGPGDFNTDRLIPHVVTSYLKNKKPTLRSNGKLIRDYLYVSDVARAYITLMSYMKKKKQKLFIYNVGSKENFRVITLVNNIKKILDKNHLKPLILNNSNIEIKRQKLNFNKIKRELNWYPKVNITQGLKKTILWYKNNLSLF
jgi:CDP-glucose 4,6-dehydratase